MMTVIVIKHIDGDHWRWRIDDADDHDDDDNEYDEVLSILQATNCQSAERFNAGLLCYPGRMGSIFDGH